MPVRIVQSKQNARLKELRRALASPGSEDDGLAAIEGPNLMEEALRAGLRVHCVFVAQGAEQICWTPALAAEIRGAAGAARPARARRWRPRLRSRSPPWSSPRTGPGRTCSAASKSAAPLMVVLAGIQDPGNLGTICARPRRLGRRGGQPAGHRERLEPEGGARFGGERLPAAVADCQPRRMLCATARGRRQVLTTTVQARKPAE